MGGHWAATGFEADAPQSTNHKDTNQTLYQSCPEGGTRVLQRYMVIQIAQNKDPIQDNCELIEYSSVAPRQGLWEANLPSTGHGCHSKEEILHRYRDVCMYISYMWEDVIGMKRPETGKDQRTKRVFVLHADGNTSRKYM